MILNLTAKQEAACRQYVLCSNKVEAYSFAYDCENMKSTTINVKVVQFIKQDKIRIRINKQLEGLNEAFKVSALQKKKMLWDIALNSAKNIQIPLKGSQGEDGNFILIDDIADPKLAITAIAELNKMDEDLVSVKQDVSIGGELAVKNKWHIHPTKAVNE